MCKTIFQDSEEFLNYFFNFKSKDEQLQFIPTIPNRFLSKLLSNSQNSTEPFCLSDLWQLYSNHAPSGPLNGGIRIIEELTKLEALKTEGLIDFIISEASKPFQSYACFKDKKGHILMDYKSPEFPSKDVIITEKGKNLSEKLKEAEENLNQVCKNFTQSDIEHKEFKLVIKDTIEKNIENILETIINN